jgi:hypothetical protein
MVLLAERELKYIGPKGARASPVTFRNVSKALNSSATEGKTDIDVADFDFSFWPWTDERRQRPETDENSKLKDDASRILRCLVNSNAHHFLLPNAHAGYLKG